MKQTHREFCRAMIAIAAIPIGLSGCVSHSARAYYSLDAEDPEFRTSKCRQALSAVGKQEDIRLARTASGPVLLLLTGGVALLPYAASHAALEAFDMKQAEEIQKQCKTSDIPSTTSRDPMPKISR